MAKYTIEDIEILRQKSGISYEEAVNLLEYHNGSLARALIDLEHRKAAKLLEGYLDAGRNVVYITLGDPTIYCTFSYIQHILEADGYQVELVSGISSFCAAPAKRLRRTALIEIRNSTGRRTPPGASLLSTSLSKNTSLGSPSTVIVTGRR